MERAFLFKRKNLFNQFSFTGFLLTSDNLKLNDGYVEIIDFNKENDTPLFFKNIIGNAKDFKIKGPDLEVVISKFSFIENRSN